MANRLDRKVEDALKDVQAVLVRSNNHLVYKLPNNATVVLSATQRNSTHLWKRQVKDIYNAAKDIK